MSIKDVTPVSGGIVQDAPEIEKAYLVEDFAGFDLLIQMGRNAVGQRVIKQQIRLVGATDFAPFIEMLLEFPNYWQDTNTGFRDPGKNPPPPPPPIGG